MSEEQKAAGDMPAEETPGSEVLEEIQSLGEELATAIKALWDSEESRKLRKEISDGFVELGQQVDAAVKSAQESEAAKQFSEQVKETVDKARQSDITRQVEEGLVTGLKALNEQLAKVATSVSAEKPAGPESESESEGEAEA